MLFSNIFQSALSSIDLFGPSVAMNIFGREKAKTNFGGLCSLLFFGFVAWAIYNGSQDLFSTLSPKVMVYDSYNGDPRLLTISRDNFPIAFNVQAPQALGYKPYIDESIYTIEVTHSVQTKTPKEDGTTETKLTTIKVKTEKCQKDHFNKQASSLTTTPLTASYCISEDQPDLANLQIQGTATSSVYQYIHAKVIQCNNATSNVTCATQEKINSYISGGYFNAIYVNMVLNPQNYTNPNATFKDMYYTMLSTSYYKEGDLKLGYVEVKTDSGLISEEKSTRSFVKVNSVSEFMEPSPHPKRILMTFKMRVSQVETYSSRSYKKLQEALAEIGGLSNVVLMVLFILTGPFLRIKLRESLMNNLFDLKMIPKVSRKDEKNASAEPRKRNSLSPKQKKSRESIDKGPKNTLGRTKSRLKTNINSYQESKTTDTLYMKHPLTVVTQPNRFDTFADKFKREVSILSPDQTAPLTLDSTVRYRENEEFLRKEPVELQVSGLEMSFQNAHGKRKISFELPVKEKKDAAPKKGKSLKPVMKSLHDENSLHLSFSSQSSESETEREEGKKPRREAKSSTIENQEENKLYYEVEVAEGGKDESKGKYSLSTKALAELEKQSSREVRDSNTSSNMVSTKINLTIWEYICSFIYKPKYLKQKLNLLKEGTKSVDEQLDILNILYRLREVNNLASVLLDQDQLELFNNLPKPEIKEKLKKKISIKALLSFNRSKKQDSDENPKGAPAPILESLEKVKNKTKRTELDKRLLRRYEEKGFES